MKIAMDIKLGSTLSPEAQTAKEQVKEFIHLFEPYFKGKIEEEADFALNKHNKNCLDTINFYNEIAIRGGKRIRGSLAYYTYKMLGGENVQASLDLARAIEMMHAFLLVLDDYTDKSSTRRGGPTAHVIAQDFFEQHTFERNDPYHYGRAVALTAGIIESFRVQEIIMGLPISAEKRISICQNLNSKLAITGYGQITDIFNSLSNDVDEKDVLNMLEWKTGVYTFENPIHSGAIMAGATQQDLELLSKYALPVGIAFQIHDDVIGMFGDSEYTGKSDKDDLMEGKMTLLIQHLFKNGTKAQVSEVLKYLGRNDVTDQEHLLVKTILVESGSLDYVEKMAVQLVERGKKHLDKAPESWSVEGLDFLRGVADYVIQRSH
jgi:geranylgeranyl diphosphate synthase type I